MRVNQELLTWAFSGMQCDGHSGSSVHVMDVFLVHKSIGFEFELANAC